MLCLRKVSFFSRHSVGMSTINSNIPTPILKQYENGCLINKY